MKASTLIKRVETAVPESDTWVEKEPYGPYLVHPDAEIKRVLYCVTPTEDVVDYWWANRYDLLISHHPFVKGIPQIVIHTALDCCPGGLNDQWRDVLGIENAHHFDKNLGWYGNIAEIPFYDLLNKVQRYTGNIIGQVYSTTDTVSSVVVCSGLGGLVTKEALATKADCYILGEATDAAERMGFKAVIETGHTLSERRPGLHFLKKLLPEVKVDAAPLAIDRYGNEVYRERKIDPKWAAMWRKFSEEK